MAHGSLGIGGLTKVLVGNAEPYLPPRLALGPRGQTLVFLGQGQFHLRSLARDSAIPTGLLLYAFERQLDGFRRFFQCPFLHVNRADHRRLPLGDLGVSDGILVSFSTWKVRWICIGLSPRYGSVWLHPQNEK